MICRIEKRLFRIKKFVFGLISISIVIFLLVLNSCKTCKCPAYSYETKPKVMEEAGKLAIAGGEWRFIEISGDWWRWRWIKTEDRSRKMEQRQRREIFVVKNTIIRGNRCRAPKYEKKDGSFSVTLVSDSPPKRRAGLFSVGNPGKPQLFLLFLRMPGFPNTSKRH